jgi:hypothetical protein
MKEPIKPRKPTKPQKPTPPIRQVNDRHIIKFEELNSTTRTSLSDLVNSVQKKHKDISLNDIYINVTDYGYYESQIIVDIELEVPYSAEEKASLDKIADVDYEKRKKKYEKALKVFDKKNVNVQ